MASPIRAHVRHFLRDVDIERVMKTLAAVSTYDRYQASEGIMAAARVVAEHAEAAGLQAVVIEEFPADGQAHWWSFEAPQSWTPKAAMITVVGERSLHIDHAARPFAIATHSAATAPGGVWTKVVTLQADLDERRGAVVALTADEFGQSGVLDELERTGAMGFVTDGPAATAGDGAAHRRRIELRADTRLCGFSLTTTEFAVAYAAAHIHASARVMIDLSTERSVMPVVSAVLPGMQSECNEEVWLTAHLCHPRPGANDNASGVAALIGVADTLVRSRRASQCVPGRRAVRFVWGPEFVGTAAMLHRAVGSSSQAGLPYAVLNLDMVGQDQRVCRSPFVVERPPDFVADILTPLAEHVVAEVFAHTRHYGETWHRAGFRGYSDHALFADASIASPAVQFCHPADVFNHSSADTLDKVSPREMLRATAAAAVITQILSAGHKTAGSLVDLWCEQEMSSALAAADRYSSIDGGDWSNGLLIHVERRNSRIKVAAAGEHVNQALPNHDAEPGGLAVHRTWAGPFNVRAMLADTCDRTRREVAALIASDKQHLALLSNLGIRVNGVMDTAEIFTDLSYSWARPIEEHTLMTLFGVLEESGWVQTE